MYLLFKEPVVEKSRDKLTLMGIEKPVNIWQPRNGSKFGSNHALKFLVRLGSFRRSGLKNNHASNSNLSYVYLFCLNSRIQVYDIDLV
jgi:hypothetical protein